MSAKLAYINFRGVMGVGCGDTSVDMREFFYYIFRLIIGIEVIVNCGDENDDNFSCFGDG